MPVALIHTQDVAFVEPLREYLTKHGCLTIVNGQTEERITYHIVAGDNEYVKEIIARYTQNAEKTLLILYEGGENEVSGYLGRKFNIVLTNAKPIDDEMLHTFLLLLFTGTSRSLIIRTKQTLCQSQSVMSSLARREPIPSVEKNNNDEMRVTEIMQQIFQPTSLHQIDKTKHAAYKFLIVGAVVALGIGVFVLSYLMSLIMAGAGLYAGGKFITSANLRFARRALVLADRGIQTADMFVRIAAPIGKIFVGEHVINDQERVVLTLTNLLIAEKSAFSIIVSGKSVVTGLFSIKDDSQSGTGLSDIIALRSEVVQLDQHLALVQTQLQTLMESQRLPFTIPVIQSFALTQLHKVENIRNKLSYFDRLFTLYPQLAGYRKKQTYMVLLQNSMELRPTGGFIGSIALVTFLDGKIIDIDVQDVYTADGQLKGHIDPPIPIREILGQEHWYLRDSNWDPNFTHSGAQAARFYEKEMGVLVDGVIGISVPFITKLLEMTGPLDLIDYNDRISSTNFFAKSLLYTQTDFFPGSTQKKDFLGSLSNALLSHITTNSSLSVGALFSAISDALDAKDIQFYMQNTELSSILQQWGWSGGIGSAACVQHAKDAPCTTEHVEVIEANLGVNKVNYFISREAESTITISDTGTITHALTYDIINKSTAQILEGGGEYHSYIRAYYPQYTNVESIEVDGSPITLKKDNTKGVQQAPYYEVGNEGDNMVVGVYLVVDPLRSKRLSVKTTRLSALSFTRGASLSIVIGKQAGIEKIPWKISIQYPAIWRAVSDGALAKQGWLEYNTTLGKNAKMSIEFEKPL